MNYQHRRKQERYVTDIGQCVGNGGHLFLMDRLRLHLRTNVKRQKSMEPQCVVYHSLPFYFETRVVWFAVSPVNVVICVFFIDTVNSDCSQNAL